MRMARGFDILGDFVPSDSDVVSQWMNQVCVFGGFVYIDMCLID